MCVCMTVYVCVPACLPVICICVHERRYIQRPDVLDSPEAGAASGCEPPVVGAGTQTRVL